MNTRQIARVVGHCALVAVLGTAHAEDTKRPIVVCRGDGGLRLQDHGCAPDQVHLADREAQRASLLRRAEHDQQIRQRMSLAARQELPADGRIELRHQDGALRDRAGRRWVRVDNGFIEISSGELFSHEQIVLDGRPATPAQPPPSTTRSTPGCEELTMDQSGHSNHRRA
jgi:hypothetical protein